MLTIMNRAQDRNSHFRQIAFFLTALLWAYKPATGLHCLQRLKTFKKSPREGWIGYINCECLMNSSILGLIVALIIAVVTVRGTTDDATHYFNIHGLLIVLGGTFSVAIIAYKFKDLWQTMIRISSIFRREAEKTEHVVKQIIDLSRRQARGESVAPRALKGAGIHPFVMDGLRYIENGFTPEEVEDILTQAMRERREEFVRQIDLINALSKYPPAFGMIGTVLGLVALMYGLGDKGATSRIGPNMAVALVATLYGLVMANYIFQPLSDNLYDKLKRELHLRRIIIRGVMMLQRRDDTVLVHEMLNAFLLPSDRLKLESDDTAQDTNRKAG